jgi:hypothetical protein
LAADLERSANVSGVVLVPALDLSSAAAVTRFVVGEIEMPGLVIVGQGYPGAIQSLIRVRATVSIRGTRATVTQRGTGALVTVRGLKGEVH